MMSHPTQRNEARANVTARAIVHGPDGRLVGGRIRNISPWGACIEHAGELRSGDPVTVALVAGERQPAMVMWATERLAGVSFVQAERCNDDVRSAPAAQARARLPVKLTLAAVLVTSSAVYAGLGRLLLRSFGA